MEGPKVATPTAALEIAELTEVVSERAKGVVRRLTEKVTMLCMEDVPIPNATLDKAVRTLPPYFSDLRSGLWSIDNSLSAIENIISRMDI